MSQILHKGDAIYLPQSAVTKTNKQMYTKGSRVRSNLLATLKVYKHKLT